MADNEKSRHPLGKRALAVLGSALFIAVLSWGHFFINQIVYTGLPSNAPIGAFAVALATSTLIFRQLQKFLGERQGALWVLVSANFLAVAALQLLAVYFFATRSDSCCSLPAI